MTSDNVIKIEDARELRELGLPILPVVDKEFSKAATRLFVEAGNAKDNFYLAFCHYCKTSSKTKRGFNRMRKALDEIASIATRAARFRSTDQAEAKALQELLTKPMVSFVEYWDAILATVERGQSVTIDVTREMLESWAVGAVPSA